MRANDDWQEGIFSYISPEKHVQSDHPLRPIRKIVDEILKEMSLEFSKLYSPVGRPSIAPERLVAVVALTDLLFRAQRAHVDRTIAVQPVVPMVCGDGDGRGGVESRRVQQESGTIIERRDRHRLFSSGVRTSNDLCRMGTLLWMGPSLRLGQPEELSTQGRKE